MFVYRLLGLSAFSLASTSSTPTHHSAFQSFAFVYATAPHRTPAACPLVCLRFLCSAWQIRNACFCFSAVSAVFIFIFILVLFFALQFSLILTQQQRRQLLLIVLTHRAGCCTLPALLSGTINMDKQQIAGGVFSNLHNLFLLFFFRHSTTVLCCHLILLQLLNRFGYSMEFIPIRTLKLLTSKVKVNITYTNYFY